MGGGPDLLLPVGVRRMSSWGDHQRRTTPSTEPGTDWYCPIGTPVMAPADGVIYGFGESIVPATGYWVGIDFDNGMSFRAMHFSEIRRRSGRVRRGDVIALSGATGYGKRDWSGDPSTGGAHVHGTLWPTRDRRFGYRVVNGRREPWTVDFMRYTGGVQLAVSVEAVELFEGDDDMYMIKANGRGTALVGARHYKSLTPAQESAWAKILGSAKQVDPGDFDQIRASAVWGDPAYMPSSTLPAETVQSVADAVARRG